MDGVWNAVLEDEGVIPRTLFKEVLPDGGLPAGCCGVFACKSKASHVVYVGEVFGNLFFVCKRLLGVRIYF